MNQLPQESGTIEEIGDSGQEIGHLVKRHLTLVEDAHTELGTNGQGKNDNQGNLAMVLSEVGRKLNQISIQFDENNLKKYFELN